MKNKRIMVVSTLAVLVVILGVAAFLAYTRSTENAQPIPVTGRSNSGVESAEQIQAQQGLQALKDQPVQAVRSLVNSQWVPGQEYMQGQPDLAININGAGKADPSWDHISGQSALPVNDLNKSYSTRGYIRFQSSGGQ